MLVYFWVVLAIKFLRIVFHLILTNFLIVNGFDTNLT